MRTSSLIVLACQSKSCAPPPVGTGGSSTSSSRSGMTVPRRDDLDEQGVEAARVAAKVRAVNILKDKDASEALASYEKSGYKQINSGLRAGRDVPSVGPSNVAAYASDKSNDRFALVPHMDRAFRDMAVTLPAPAYLYRTVRLGNGAGGMIKFDTTPGTVITDKGFCSTSIAGQWGEIAMIGTLLRIKAPAGTKVLGGKASEGELILNRGTSMRVIGESVVRGQRVIDVEIVP
jgi:hypothetical protein